MINSQQTFVYIIQQYRIKKNTLASFSVLHVSYLSGSPRQLLRFVFNRESPSKDALRDVGVPLVELLSRRPVNLLILFDQRLINKRKSKTFSLIPIGIENQEKRGREEEPRNLERKRRRKQFPC